MSAIGLLEEIVLARAPKFLRGKNLGRLLKSYAVTLDGNNEALRQGLTFNNPLVCPAEMLPPVAKDRALKIPPSMPEDGVRNMLASWLQLHRARAGCQGVLRHVRNYFAPGPYPSMQIVHENGTTATWHKLNSAGEYSKTAIPTNWNYDNLHEWGKWYFITEDEDDDGTPIPSLVSPAEWDDGSEWDDGTVWDGMTTQVALDLVSMAIDWKRAGTRMQAFIVNRSPGSIGPDTVLSYDGSGWSTLPTAGNWKEPMSITGDPTRPPYLDWIYEYD